MEVRPSLTPEELGRQSAETYFGFTTPDGRPKQRWPGVIPPKGWSASKELTEGGIEPDQQSGLKE